MVILKNRKPNTSLLERFPSIISTVHYSDPQRFAIVVLNSGTTIVFDDQEQDPSYREFLNERYALRYVRSQ